MSTNKAIVPIFCFGCKDIGTYLLVLFLNPRLCLFVLIVSFHESLAQPHAPPLASDETMEQCRLIFHITTLLSYLLCRTCVPRKPRRIRSGSSGRNRLRSSTGLSSAPLDRTFGLGYLGYHDFQFRSHHFRYHALRQRALLGACGRSLRPSR